MMVPKKERGYCNVYIEKLGNYIVNVLIVIFAALKIHPKLRLYLIIFVYNNNYLLL